MKNPKFSISIVVVIFFVLAISFWPRSTQTPQKDAELPRVLAEKSTPPEVAALPHVGTQSESQPSNVQTASSRLSENASGFERFNEWASRYVAATKEQRRELVEEGIKIAQGRRVELLRLIETDPRRAIENAVPPVLRQQLPLAIAELLEERVNETGFYGVIGAVPSAENPGTPAYRREVRTSDGGRYRAFVYGRRLSQRTTENTSIVGIAVDDTMAIDERPLRTVASGEIPNHTNNLTRRRTVSLLDEQGFSNGREQQTSPAPPRDVVEVCPVSGEITAKSEESVAVTETEIVVEAGGQFHFLCRGGHIVEFEEKLLSREGGNGGPVMPTSPPSATQSIGYKTHLLMRIAFPEALKGIMTEKEGHDYGKSVQDWFMDNSYGAMTFMTTVTPLIIMPRSEAWYKDQDTDGDANEVLIDARVAAKAAGYDPANFNFDTVIYNGPGSFGGQAYVGGKGCWMRTTSIGTACHEYGHNFGLMHANFWDTTNGSSIGGGSHVEYGDIFDTMGASSSNGEFNAYQKNLLNWLPNQLVHEVTTSGTYRIYQTDQPAQNPRLRYALKTRKDADRDYWVDFRQDFPANAWVQSGVFLHWSPWATSESGSHLLDATPGSIDGKNDAPVVIGRTFSDLETGIHITPIAKNATTPPSADVVVNLGLFPGNSAPVLAVGASATSVTTNTAINFTATASDLDGDVLSYAWDFGDKSFSTTNSPVVSKSWATAGEYRVRCTVSDMKGKTASESIIVTIGTTSTFRIAGTITAGGQPLANVRVHNSLTGTNYREAYTDADGAYTLTRLAAGTYTVATQLYGYTLTPTGSASVTVGPSKTGVNFTAADQPQVSIVVQDADCAEGVNTGSFRISRTGSTAAALTVSLYAPSGSATKGTDYTLAPDVVAASPFQTFTIPAGQDFLDVLVTASDDVGVESFERAILELVPSTSYVIGTGTATLWIADADTANPLVRLSVADRDADESEDPGQFVIERLGSTTAALNVSVTITGTATNGTDYVSIPTTISIPVGASSVPVNVTPIQDTLVENMETVILTISTNAAYTRPSSSVDYTGTVNLHDDDQPILTVVATDPNASEAGNDPGVFTVTRTGSTAAALTVNYGITGGALHGTDYVALPGVLTIPAGSAVGTVVITPIDDTIGEPAQTVAFQLRGGLNYTVGASSNATVTITDDDLPYTSIAVTTGPAIEGGTAGVFKVTTTGTGTGNITLLYTVTGTATNGTDYSTLSGTLSIAKNATGNITISTIQDAVAEGYETVTITLTPDPSYSLAVDSSATMNLQDDDAPQVNVSTTDDAFTEINGSLAKFFVSRTGSTTSALTVNYTLGGTATSGSDYTAPSGSVTIAAAAVGAFVDISVLDDALAEGTETIVLNVTPSAAYAAGIGSATRYIIDAELASVVRQVRFSAATSSAAENSGSVNIPVTLDAAAAETVTVEYFINGGTALAGGIDYTLIPGSLTFAPGETSKNIPVAISDDSLDESNATIVIALANPNNAKLGTSSHTLTITDDDAPPGVTVGFAGATGSGLESESTAPLTVALSTAQAGPVTVNYAVTDGTATGGGTDYTITAGTLTFAAGETVKVIPNTIVNDASVDSGETIILTLSNPGGAVLSANPVFTYTITDDDAATVTIAATNPSAAEPGIDTGLFTVTRTGSTTAALTVNFSVSGTATSGADYANITNSVVIAAGASSATVVVTPLDDTMIESAETVILTLTSGVYTVGTENAATVSIADDESGMLITIAASDATAAEVGNPGEFTVTRTGSTVDSITVNLSVSGTATAVSDYTALPSSVVIPAAAASVTIAVSPLADALNEGDETVTLTALSGVGYSRGSPVAATITIANTDDGSPPTLSPSSIVDDKGGVSVFIDTLVTYTVTFDKDMDATTVTAADFGNAGTATVTIDTVTETTANSGVFTVQATPTNGGTLQLRVNAGAVLNSVAGTNLDTTSAITDNTTITVAGTAPTLASALDTTGITWSTSGNLPWFPQSTTTHDATDAAQSGAIADSQTSTMETTVTGPGTLTFWWKVSSESGYDFLRFYLNGAEQAGAVAISGTSGTWAQKTISIPAGSQTIKWTYSKDSSVASGSDAAWVDEVVYTPSSAPEIAVEQPVGTNLTDGSSTINLGSINTGSSSLPFTFTVKNTGTANLTGLAITKDGTNNADYAVSALGATTLAPAASTTFTVTFAPGAADSRTAAIHIASNDTDENPFDINLAGTGVPLGTLDVTSGGLASSGTYGGSFSPSSKIYTLTNVGSTSINWTAGKTQSWVTLSATSGTLAAGATTTVTASINTNANTLASNSYSDTVTFTNTTNGLGNATRAVDLTVNVLSATVNLSNLLQTYNGSPRPVTVTTTPSGLACSVTYNGSSTVPTTGGTYAVVATITEPNYAGSASGNLVISHTVSYQANGNTSGTVPADQTKYQDVDLTLATNSGNLNKSDFSFVAWNTAADGSGTDYALGGTYSGNVSLVLYAKWAPGADGTWAQTAAGPFDWSTSGNWSGGTIAAGADRTASFTPNIAAAQVVNLDSARTIGNITFTDSTTASHDLTISGSNVLTLARTSGIPTINVTNRTLTISSQISGNGGLKKAGAGNLTLSGTNDYTGGTVISAGTLAITLDSNLGAASGGITFDGTSSLSMGVTTLGTGRTITINGGVTATFTQGTNGLKTILGPLTGAGTLVFNNTTGLSFQNASNNFSGIINATTGNTLSYGLEFASIGDGVGAGLINLNNGSFRWINTSGGATTLTNRQFALSGTTSGGTISALGNTGSILAITKDLLVTGDGNKTFTLAGTNTGANRFAGNISNGNVGGTTDVISLTKSEAGSWALSGTNTYSGDTNLSAANGTLTFSGSQSLSPNTIVRSTVTSGGSTTVRLLDDAAGTINFSRPFTLTGGNTTNAMTIFVGNNGGVTTGSTAQIGTFTWNTATGAAVTTYTLNATGANGYRLETGAMTLSNLSNRTAGSNFTTVLNPTTAPLTVASVTMAAGNAVNGGIPILELGGTSGTTSNFITGSITNASDVGTTLRPLSITKTGSASNWTLQGANAYTGTTTVTAGKLFINGDQSLATGNVSVASAATLGGSGKIGGSVTIATGGKLEFDISTSAGAHNPLDISPGKDFIFSGTSTLTITSSGSLAAGTYTLITGGNSITGVAPATLNVSVPVGGVASTYISGNSLMLKIVGPIDHFAISPISSPRTVNTPITGVVITAQDSANQTITTFNGTVSFGGTAGVTGTSASFVNGVLSGVSITPSVLGDNRTFTVNDGSGHVGTATFNVQSAAYSGWVSTPFQNTFTDTALTSNPDGDNLTNLQEFAFGLDPTSPTTSTLGFTMNGDVTEPGVPILMNFAASGQPAEYRAVFARRKDYVAANVNYTVVFSADLQLWTASSTNLNVVTNPASSGELEAVSIPFPATVPVQGGGAQQAPKFFRVGVAGN